MEYKGTAWPGEFGNYLEHLLLFVRHRRTFCFYTLFASEQESTRRRRIFLFDTINGQSLVARSMDMRIERCIVRIIAPAGSMVLSTRTPR